MKSLALCGAFLIFEAPMAILDKRVELMVIGAMKCGTTTLSDLLTRHPDVCFCSNKEPDIFSKDNNWRENLANYHSLFSEQNKRWVEASTSYTFYPHFNKRIWKDLYEYNPDLKLIYLYRDPIQRCISHYMHVYERAYIDHTLEDAIKKVPLIVNNSRYAMQVKPFIQQFGAKQVLLMDLSELAGERTSAIARIADFTGLSLEHFPAEEKSHKNSSLSQDKHDHKYDDPSIAVKGILSITPQPLKKKVWNTITGTGRRGFDSKPELSAEWREAIVRLLESDILEFEKLTGRDLGHWFKNGGLERSSSQ